ncbi:hypothetical protein Bca4012_037056 [Brassica carinata]|uniref:Uncharacterized protein n=1 Tax=Brassica carinata TaxID=52824 RepID=A0A8X7WGM9_BRACI|nr:hypothetical protein Bca52824_010746 [Brassica carinata]
MLLAELKVDYCSVAPTITGDSFLRHRLRTSVGTHQQTSPCSPQETQMNHSTGRINLSRKKKLKEQQEVIRSKPSVVILIEELESSALLSPPSSLKKPPSLLLSTTTKLPPIKTEP